jgi:acetate---CoA ligase (ADP-forming)
MRQGLDALFCPSSVAIVGASADPQRIGGRPIAYTLAAGFRGKIFPVNPNRAEVQGLRCFDSIAALPETPDVAIVAIPGEGAVSAIAELGRRGCKAAIVFTAGMGEVGPAGLEVQNRMVALARQHGMRLLGPNCLGMFNARSHFYPIFSSTLSDGFPVPGHVGIASQSGAFGTHLFVMAQSRRVGVASLITTGNEAETTLSDVLAHMVEDPGLEVLLAYSEGMRDGDRFVATLEAARKAHKPIIIMKVGRSQIGKAAAASHTGSIAGDDAIFDAVLAEFGALRASTTEHLLDLAQAATKRIYPVGNTLGVITISGGAGVLISDAAEEVGLSMPEMPKDTQAALKKYLPFSSARNPVDCTAQVVNEASLIGRFTKAMVEGGGYKSILGFFTHSGGSGTLAKSIRDQMNEVRESNPDRLYALSVLASPELERQYEDDGYLIYADPTRAVIALEAMGRVGEAFARCENSSPAIPAVELPAKQLDEAEAKKILAKSGISIVKEEVCKTPDEAVATAAQFGGRVVMKVLSPDILHKSEIGGVILNVEGEQAVRVAFATLMGRARAAIPSARIEGVLVAQQLIDGVECVLGIYRDPVFGPIAMFGLGGVFIEVMKDVVFRRCPFDELEATRMISSIKGRAVLHGARGKPLCDVEALAQMLSRLSIFAAGAGKALKAIDLNPVLVLPKGQGAYAVDALIDIANGDDKEAGTHTPIRSDLSDLIGRKP